MITKKALIFGYPGEKGGENYCSGVFHDMHGYYSHFTSLCGGAWKVREEIFIEKQPITKKRLKKYIEYFNCEAEYSIFIFVGHGEYHEDYGTIIQLNAKEKISEFDLSLDNVSRRLNIFDCCREKTIFPMQGRYLKESYISQSFSASNVELYRECFNSLLGASIKGNINIYSCSINERSKDISNLGGLFSYHLLRNTIGNENLSIYKAFKKAEPIVKRLSSYEQNPVIDRPRVNGNSFPFYLKP